MRICIVTDSYPPNIGGAEYAVGRIAEGLAAVGLGVVIVTSNPIRSLSPLDQKGMVKVLRIRIPLRLKRFWFAIIATPLVIREGRSADLIHGTTYGGVLPAFFASVILRKPSVLMVHELMGRSWFRFEPTWIRAAFYYLAERIMVLLPFERFVAVSEYTKNVLLELGARNEKIRVIPHGIEDGAIQHGANDRESIREQYGISPNNFLYLAYGRIGVTKGFEYLIDAIPMILQIVPSARFLLILTKYDKRIWDRIVKKVKRLPAGVCEIEKPVSREKLTEIQNAADCIVIPSLSEGFGFAAVEACKLGKKMVATSAGSLPEVVFGEHVFVRPGSAEALAKGCASAFRGDVAFKEEKYYNWEQCIEGYRSLYQELVK